MAKRKHSVEWMIDRVNEYLSGMGSYDSIAHANDIAQATLIRWVAAYRNYGADAFTKGAGNKRYSKEFKTSCVDTVIKGELSVKRPKHKKLVVLGERGIIHFFP